MQRCQWATMGNSPLMVQYHDKEWGVAVHKDRTLFEFLVLESAQAGLSWQTVLNKRENYREAFHAFDPANIARYKNKDVQRLLRDPGIIRNRLKIQATINNAKQILQLQKEYGSFDKYLWQFVGDKPIKHRFESLGEIGLSPTNCKWYMLKATYSFCNWRICFSLLIVAWILRRLTTQNKSSNYRRNTVLLTNTSGSLWATNQSSTDSNRSEVFVKR